MFDKQFFLAFADSLRLSPCPDNVEYTGDTVADKILNDSPLTWAELCFALRVSKEAIKDTLQRDYGFDTDCHPMVSEDKAQTSFYIAHQIVALFSLLSVGQKYQQLSIPTLCLILKDLNALEENVELSSDPVKAQKFLLSLVKEQVEGANITQLERKNNNEPYGKAEAALKYVTQLIRNINTSFPTIENECDFVQAILLYNILGYLSNLKDYSQSTEAHFQTEPKQLSIKTISIALLPSLENTMSQYCEQNSLAMDLLIQTIGQKCSQSIEARAEKSQKKQDEQTVSVKNL